MKKKTKISLNLKKFIFLFEVFHTILYILKNPNAYEPVNEEIAEIYVTNRELFIKNANSYTREHCL